MMKQLTPHEFLLHLGIDLATGKEVYQPILERSRMTAIFGQTGGGKSEGIKFQIRQIMQSGHGILLLDGHRQTAQDVLDEAIRAGPAVTPRVLYLSSLHPECTAMIDLLQRQATTPLRRIAERETLAKEFSQVLVRTADAGGRDATVGMVRFMNNVTMATYALYDANLPFAFMPHLFTGPSPILDAVLSRTTDQSVIEHFRKIAGFRDTEREKYTESILNRLHQLFSSLMLRAMLSLQGDLTVSQLLEDRRIVIVDAGPAEGNTPEHARLLQSILINAYFRAAQRRGEQEALLSPCHLFSEEAATIVGPAEVELMAQARKFGLWATLIFQGFEGLQHPDYDLVSGVLNNSGTKMVFRLGNDRDARRLADILYAAQVDPRRVMEYRERTSQRVSGHREIDTRSSSTTQSERQYDYRGSTRANGFTQGTHFLPEYEEHTELEPVHMTTSDQFLEATAGLINLQPGQFVLQTPSIRRPRLCYSPMLPDPYRCMPGIREKRRREFLERLFADLPYKDTEGVLRDFRQLAASFDMPDPGPNRSPSQHDPFS